MITRVISQDLYDALVASGATGADPLVTQANLGDAIEIIEVANLAALPVIGEAGKLYVTIDTNFIYRWDGAAYVQVANGSGTTNLAVANVTTTTIDITSDTGNDATLPSATVTEAGLMVAADKTKLDYITVTQAVDLDTMGTDISNAIPNSEKGAANGVATLGGDGKVPSGQLPSYVDDVLEYANLAALPGTGETGKIYVTLDDNKIYRWTGSVYVEVSASAGAPVTSVNTQTGAVVLDADDIDDSATAHKFVTATDLTKLGNLSGTNTGDQTATTVSVTPTGDLSSTTVQAALVELQGDIDTLESSQHSALTLGGTANDTTDDTLDLTGQVLTVNLASPTTDGAMSAADKSKLNGVAANANNYVHPNHSGDVTSVADGATTISNDAVTNAKLANMATQTFKGRTTAGTGDPEDLSVAQAKTLLNLTGTNSGDQTITLTNDVTGSGTGSFAATIASNAVSNTKLADVPTQTFKGRTTAGTGDPEDLTVAQAKTLLNLTGTNNGDQTSIVGITGTKAQFDTAVTDGNFLYVGDVTSNATHTGEVTGATSLTVDKTAITNKTTVTPVSGDFVLISDTSDSGNLKKVDASNFLGGAGHAAVTLNADDTTQETLNLSGQEIQVNLATTTTDGAMSSEDKLKVDSLPTDVGDLLSGPLGTTWSTGLTVTANSPADQAVDVSAGTYFVSGIEYSHGGTANFSLATDFTALTAGQRRIALIYIDATNVVQRALGVITSSSNKAIAPSQPANSVCLAYVLIDKNQNDIETADITDCRTSPNSVDTDELVKISSADTTGKYLSQALSNAGNVDFTIENAGGNETLKADVDLSGKQDSLVSGTNIKTVNGNTLLGSGDLVVAPSHDTVNAAGNITTTSLTAVIVTSMTLTPGAGTYLVHFNSDLLHSSAIANTTMQIHANGTLVTNSARVYRVGSASANRMSSVLQAVVTVGAGSSIDVRWFTSTGTATLGNRILTLIKLA